MMDYYAPGAASEEECGLGAAKRARSKFTADEDRVLWFQVMRHGDLHWGLIAAGVPGRSVRQCRERWRHYLAPGLASAPWTDAEDAVLEARHRELGPRWKAIAAVMPIRTEIQVKNRFLLMRRRAARISHFFTAAAFRSASHVADAAPPLGDDDSPGFWDADPSFGESFWGPAFGSGGEGCGLACDFDDCL